MTKMLNIEAQQNFLESLLHDPIYSGKHAEIQGTLEKLEQLRDYIADKEVYGTESV